MTQLLPTSDVLTLWHFDTFISILLFNFSQYLLSCYFFLILKPPHLLRPRKFCRNAFSRLIIQLCNSPLKPLHRNFPVHVLRTSFRSLNNNSCGEMPYAHSSG